MKDAKDTPPSGNRPTRRVVAGGLGALLGAGAEVARTPNVKKQGPAEEPSREEAVAKTAAEDQSSNQEIQESAKEEKGEKSARKIYSPG